MMERAAVIEIDFRVPAGFRQLPPQLPRGQGRRLAGPLQPAAFKVLQPAVVLCEGSRAAEVARVSGGAVPYVPLQPPFAAQEWAEGRV